MVWLQLIAKFRNGGFSLAFDVIQEISVFLPIKMIIAFHHFFIEENEILILIQIFKELWEFR